MGIEQLDFLDESADQMDALLNAGNTADALALVTQLRGLIIAEKRKIYGDGNTLYDYRCSGCSLVCSATFKFEPSVDLLRFCRFDGSMAAIFSQILKRTI